MTLVIILVKAKKLLFYRKYTTDAFKPRLSVLILHIEIANGLIYLSWDWLMAHCYFKLLSTRQSCNAIKFVKFF